jgi:hypothetical protein
MRPLILLAWLLGLGLTVMLVLTRDYGRWEAL